MRPLTLGTKLLTLVLLSLSAITLWSSERSAQAQSLVCNAACEFTPSGPGSYYCLTGPDGVQGQSCVASQSGCVYGPSPNCGEGN
jgi:hypothetical protein